VEIDIDSLDKGSSYNIYRKDGSHFGHGFFVYTDWRICKWLLAFQKEKDKFLKLNASDYYDIKPSRVLLIEKDILNIVKKHETYKRVY
jgi:hypothetical protein